MTKPICVRGFEVEEKLSAGRARYRTESDGQESIKISHEGGYIYVASDDRDIKELRVFNSQYYVHWCDGVYLTRDTFPKETEEINFQQAREVFDKVKELLNVDKRLEEYKPRFSSQLEITVFNSLGIDDVSELNLG